MSVTEIQLYKSLESKLGEAGTQELISFIKSEINTQFMDCKDVFMVKADKGDLVKIMKDDKAELIKIMKDDKVELMRFQSDFRTEVIRAMAAYKVDISNVIGDYKVDIIRAIFIGNLVTYLAILGSALGILSFILKK